MSVSNENPTKLPTVAASPAASPAGPSNNTEKPPPAPPFGGPTSPEAQLVVPSTTGRPIIRREQSQREVFDNVGPNHAVRNPFNPRANAATGTGTSGSTGVRLPTSGSVSKEQDIVDEYIASKVNETDNRGQGDFETFTMNKNPTISNETTAESRTTARTAFDVEEYLDQTRPAVSRKLESKPVLASRVKERRRPLTADTKNPALPKAMAISSTSKHDRSVLGENETTNTTSQPNSKGSASPERTEKSPEDTSGQGYDGAVLDENATLIASKGLKRTVAAQDTQPRKKSRDVSFSTGDTAANTITASTEHDGGMGEDAHEDEDGFGMADDDEVLDEKMEDSEARLPRLGGQYKGDGSDNGAKTTSSGKEMDDEVSEDYKAAGKSKTPQVVDADGQEEKDSDDENFTKAIRILAQAVLKQKLRKCVRTYRRIKTGQSRSNWFKPPNWTIHSLANSYEQDMFNLSHDLGNLGPALAGVNATEKMDVTKFLSKRFATKILEDLKELPNKDVSLGYRPWKNLEDKMYLLVSRTIFRCSRNVKQVGKRKKAVEYIIQFFFDISIRGDRVYAKLATYTPSIAFVQKTFTDRVLKLMELCKPKNIHGWMNVNKEEFYREIVDPVIFTAFRPRADGGLDCKGLDTRGDSYIVAYTKQEEFFDAAMWEAGAPAPQDTQQILNDRRTNEDHTWYKLSAGHSKGKKEVEFAVPQVPVKHQDNGWKCIAAGFLSAVAMGPDSGTPDYSSCSDEFAMLKIEAQYSKALSSPSQADNCWRGTIASVFSKDVTRCDFHKCKGFDPLNNKYQEPVMVRLKGTNHSVTFYKGTIFDSSYPFALKLTKYNLNIISGGSYKGVAWAQRLVERGD